MHWRQTGCTFLVTWTSVLVSNISLLKPCVCVLVNLFLTYIFKAFFRCRYYGIIHQCSAFFPHSVCLEPVLNKLFWELHGEMESPLKKNERRVASPFKRDKRKMWLSSSQSWGPELHRQRSKSLKHGFRKLKDVTCDSGLMRFTSPVPFGSVFGYLWKLGRKIFTKCSR